MTSKNTSIEPLAIVGMACRFPGADNLEQFWQLLIDGKNTLGPLPPDRLELETSYSPERGVFGKTYCNLAGVVDHRPVDRSIFPISDEVATRYDVVQLTFGEVVAAACLHAGYDPLSLPTRNAGVYIGNFSSGSELENQMAYHRHADSMAAILADSPAFGDLAPEIRDEVIRNVVGTIRRDYPSRMSTPVVGQYAHVMANMVIELFGLTGPAMAIDAACASSVVAIQVAAGALESGAIDMAIVGGAGCRKVYELAGISQAGSMTQTGCSPFDARADGIVCSDGYGVVLIKTLARAIADGDGILGVIRSIGYSSDGRGKSFWAPRREGQALAVRRAYENIDPATVQYIEAHATSTELGDATEVQSLTDAMGELLSRKIPIASVKGNIGHTLETAGIAGLIKTVLSMQYGTIPCAANFHTPTSSVDWDRVPFFVPEHTLSWPPSGEDYVRRAGVNSFGVGGINVHIVVDQAYGSPVPQLSSASDNLQATAPLRKGAREPLAIVGASCLLPGAENLESLRQWLETAGDATQPVPPEREMGTVGDTPSPNEGRRGGFLTGYEFDWKTFRIAPKLLAVANSLQFMMLDAASRALADAGFANSAVDRTRVATIVGTVFHGDYQIEHWYGVWMWDFVKRLSQALKHCGASTEFTEYVTQSFVETLQARKPAARDETASAAYSTLASRIAKHFDLMGGAFAVDAADASAMAALAWAHDQLSWHNCDMVICAGGQRSMDLTYCDDYVSRGHQASQSDVTLGEGAMCVILKRLSDARRDGDRIHGILHSSTFASGATLKDALAQTMRETRKRSTTASRSSNLDEAARFSFCEPGNSSRIRPFGDLLGANGLLLLLRGLLQLDRDSSSEPKLDKSVTSLRLTTNRGMLSPAAGTVGEIVLERGSTDDSRDRRHDL